MAEQPIRVLVIAEDEESFLLVERILSKCAGGRLELEHVFDPEDAAVRVRNGDHDLYLVKFQNDGRKYLSLISDAIAQGHSRPFILLTDQDGDAVDVGACEPGFVDYLATSALDVATLNRSICSALDRVELNILTAEKKLRDRLAAIVDYCDTIPELLASAIQAISEQWAEESDWCVQASYDGCCYPPVPTDQAVLHRSPLTTQRHNRGELRIHSNISNTFSNRTVPPRERALVETAARVLSAAIDKIDLAESRRNFARFVADNPNPVVQLDREGRVRAANAAAGDLLEFWKCSIDESVPDSWRGLVNESLDRNQPSEQEIEHRGVHYTLQFVPIVDDGRVNIYGTNVTQRIQVERTLQERVELAALAAEVGLVLTRGGALHEALQGCVSAIIRHSRATQARVWRFLPNDRILELHASAGFHTHLNALHRRIPLGEGRIGWIALTRRNYVTNLLEDEPRGDDAVWAQLEGLKSFAGFPLVVNDHLVGVLGIYSPGRLSQETIDTFTSLADEIALGMEQKEAAHSAQRLVSLLEATPDFVAISDTEHQGVYLNRAAKRMLGVGADEDVAGVNWLRATPQWVQQLLNDEALPRVFTEGYWQGELAITTQDGAEVPVSQVILAHHTPRGTVEYISTIARDISESKLLEEQFRQSQKLEGIGRLAGGVAHDFNNLLTGIRGFADLALQETTDDGIIDDLLQIREISDRSAELTRQLLAFSRRQRMSPMITNINHLVDRTSRLLRRLIGEHIDLAFTLDPALGNVRVDPGQIEQILVNLAVNARDAMPNGGRLLIETSNAELSKDYLSRHTGVELGKHVMLAVTDTGCGMDAATRERIFEPFFTTKPLGEGTGLGLSTVYGIVKQQMGSIWVYSEPGMGATFKIYFPVVGGAVEEKVESESPAVLEGDEMILVVEDEEAVREVTRRILTGYGYSVLCAADPVDARQLFMRNASKITLLLSDVVMPGLSGTELYQQLSDISPSLKVVYMSGYTDNAIVHHGVLEPGLAFIQKPFNAADLVRKVRAVLDDRSTA